MDSGAEAFESIARSAQKTALDTACIQEVTAQGVTIGWPDRQRGQPPSPMPTGETFLHRFFQHEPPRGFARLRHFG